jgi:hypothetical protein
LSVLHKSLAANDAGKLLAFLFVLTALLVNPLVEAMIVVKVGKGPEQYRPCHTIPPKGIQLPP